MLKGVTAVGERKWMEKEQFEDFFKHWDFILRGLDKMARGVNAIDDAFTKERRQDIKRMDSRLDPMRKSMEEYESNIRHTMESVECMGNAFAKKMEEINHPEAMCNDIRECAVKMSDCIKPVLELLSEVQVRWEK